MNSRAHWFWHCLLSVAAIAFLGFFMAAIEQRDEARRMARPTINMRGTILVVSCQKPITPAAAPGVHRQQPRLIL